MDHGSFSMQGPPHNIEAEMNILGCVMIDKSCLETVWQIIDVSDFYRETHKTIFQVLCYLGDSDKPIDLISVPDELRRRNKLDAIGGMPYLTSLFEAVPTSANCEYYAGQVKEYAVHRQVISLLAQANAEARGYVENPYDLLDKIQGMFAQAVTPVRDGGLLSAGPTMAQVIEKSEAAALARLNGESVVTGIRTGLRVVDNITGGLQPADLIIVAARPSMGKTSLALEWAVYAVLVEGKSVAIFSLEMTSYQLCVRLACSYLEIDSRELNAGILAPEKAKALNDLAHRLMANPKLFICEQNELTPAQMRLHLRKMKHDVGVDMVVVDYLQMCRTERKTNTNAEAVGEIARGLKNIAREFKAPMVALSQLSRAVESRENKRPILSDLRESGGIEAEADLVCFLYRDAYYAMKALVQQSPDQSQMRILQAAQEEETELIFGKHRNGPTGTVKVGFVPKYTKFKNLVPVNSDDPTGF